MNQVGVRHAITGGASVAAAMLPVVVLAAEPRLGSWAQNLVSGLDSVVKTLVAIAFAAVFLAFFWGLARYLWSGSDEMKSKGKDLMIWSVIGMFVAISIWGLVGLLSSLFGVDAGSVETGDYVKKVDVNILQ